MKCAEVLDKVYEYSGWEQQTEDPLPLLTQIQINLHLLICPDCAQEVERFEVTRDILRYDFLPSSPGLENSIMARIAVEEAAMQTEDVIEVPGGISTRGWIITGLVILVSLATVFLGLDFNRIARGAGMSFLLPVGITIGAVLTSYGALFIGSHLKELSQRFGL